ncbi:DUF4388 domain-containing protein [Deinococcus deserti]|uniref:PatA-like N-terminal domain-containing protein n=1 Tax=Deinococcus deserti (strain DSM 17065 / CIP 109153 / LMG 22923 / VCD115) TaxID=546414 RepID=C1D1L1_DEIDV|nr:DUF4388 domain-containing protein [Deinococcus deserti]ACO45735.1 hypothetical protein Deide_08610 [Deinococcus deserti VCD115]
MVNTTISLEAFDVLELLYLLAGQRRTGALQVVHNDGRFTMWMEDGRVQALRFGPLSGSVALRQLLLDPHGHSSFLPGARLPTPLELNATLDEVVIEALLHDIPVSELPFSGPGRITEPPRVNVLKWSDEEQHILRQIDAQHPVGELAVSPAAVRLILTLIRMGLLVPTRSRLARLTVVMTRQVQGMVLVDEVICRRWHEALQRPPARVAVKTGCGMVHTLAVCSAPDLGRQLLIPPELLLQTGIQGGDSVLVQPV